MPLIDLYTWSTPNGRKISIMLEECALPYTVHGIDISKDQQFDPSFLAISPNNKIPAIRDSDNGQTVFESGAILIYLAEKTGRFMPTDPAARYATLEWLMFQMGGVGPMLGRAHYFLRFNPGKAPFAEDWFRTEAQRLYGVMNRRLADNEWFAGAEYTIADMAIFPWLAPYEWQGIKLDDFPHVRRWYDTMRARPAVRKGFDVPQRGAEIPA